MRRMGLVIAACASMTAAHVFACTGMYAGRKVSADGTVLIGRTVDTPPWSCCFRAVRVPRGEGVKYAYVCTPAVTSVGKGFFPSVCANEAGLVISGTVTGHTRKEILELDPKTSKDGVGERNLPGLVVLRIPFGEIGTNVIADNKVKAAFMRIRKTFTPEVGDGRYEEEYTG